MVNQQTETFIEGERTIPLCGVQSYTIHLPLGQENTNITWKCSPNLRIISGVNSSAVQIKAVGSGEAWIYAEANNLTHSKNLAKFYINITDEGEYENAPLEISENTVLNEPIYFQNILLSIQEKC